MRPDINSTQVLFHGSCSLCISIHCMCPVQSPALMSARADSNQASESHFQRGGGGRVCADEGQNQSESMFGSKLKTSFFLFKHKMSSVEPQLIRQVQILQHDLVIRLRERPSLCKWASVTSEGSV